MKINRFILGTFAAAILNSTASAQIIVDDNFDGYADQAAFEAVWVPIGTNSPSSGTLSTSLASSAPNAISIAGTTASGQYRNRLSFSDTPIIAPGMSLSFSFDFYDSTPAESPQRNFSNLQDSTSPAGTGQLIAMGLNNNQTAANSGGNFYMARILGYDPTTGADPDGGPAQSVAGSGAFFKLNDFGIGLRSLGW